MTAADYIKAVAAPNFRSAWEELGEDTEIANEYGLGVRESLQVGHDVLTLPPNLVSQPLCRIPRLV